MTVKKKKTTKLSHKGNAAHIRSGAAGGRGTAQDIAKKGKRRIKHAAHRKHHTFRNANNAWGECTVPGCGKKLGALIHRP